MTMVREPRSVTEAELESSAATPVELNVGQQIADAIATIDHGIADRKDRIAKLQLEISGLQASREALIRAAQALPAPAYEPSQAAYANARRTKRIRTNSRAEAVRLVVEKTLRAANRPMQRGELFGHVRAAGIVLPGDHPEKKLSKIMSSAKDRFINTGDGYWLADIPIPQSE